MDYKRISYSENKETKTDNNTLTAPQREHLLNSCLCQFLKEKNIKINTISICRAHNKLKARRVHQESRLLSSRLSLTLCITITNKMLRMSQMWIWNPKVMGKTRRLNRTS